MFKSEEEEEEKLAVIIGKRVKIAKADCQI
jgi:hypothetical protein